MIEDKTRLRVKIGAAEIEYEGSQDFLKQEVMPKITQMMGMADAEASARRTELIDATASSSFDVSSASRELDDLSTSTIAQLLSVKSASDLALAALARLILIEERDTLNRNEILDEMKKATPYFKKSFVNNHSNTLLALIKSGKVRETANGYYTLSPDARNSLKNIIFGS